MCLLIAYSGGSHATENSYYLEQCDHSDIIAREMAKLGRQAHASSLHKVEPGIYIFVHVILPNEEEQFLSIQTQLDKLSWHNLSVATTSESGSTNI